MHHHINKLLASLVKKNDFENATHLIKYFREIDNYRELEIIIENAFKNGEYDSIIFITELIINRIIHPGFFMNDILLSLCHKNIFFPINHIIKKTIKTQSYDNMNNLNDLFNDFIYSGCYDDNIDEPFMKRFIPYIINVSYDKWMKWGEWGEWDGSICNKLIL